MGNIVLLDDLTINQIAAGEVIERPASVIKEMVENSIDAGANNITVEIKNGGISFIRITDNGKGISQDDLEIAFERHATSKIRSAGDLDTVTSMGFRGEALASIAAISNVELISKTAEQETGYRVVVEAGNILEKEEAGCPTGTSITVRNLFFNTPVRYKFLRKDYTESGYIEDVITRIALVNPDIAFKLINTGKTVIQTNGNGDLKTVIYSIYGKDVAEGVIPVSYTYEDIKVEGVIGKPEISRSNRAYQLFFVNQRFIKDKTLSAATEQAYKGMIPIGKFGFVVLNITMNPAKVDVNVHPAKLEVRFQEESKIFQSIYHSIKDTLLKGDIGLADFRKTTEKQIEEYTKQESEIKTNPSVQVKKEEPKISNLNIGQPMNTADVLEKLRALQEGIEKDVAENPQIILNEKYLNLNQKNDIVEEKIEVVEEKIEAVEEEKIEVAEEEKAEILVSSEIVAEENVEEELEQDKVLEEEEKTEDTLEETQQISSEELVQIKEKMQNLEDNTYVVSNDFDEMYQKLFGKALKKEDDEQKLEDSYMTADIVNDHVTVFEGIAEYQKPLYQFIGIVFKTYIMIEMNEEMYIIDQHAAHERIMYEKVKKNYYSDSSKDSQMLLLPDVITLTHKEMDIAKDNMEMFKKAGFDLEEFGENTIKLTGVPTICIDLDNKDLFLETLDEINTIARTAKQEKEERFIATVACKAAVKANMGLRKEEVENLLDQLLELPNPFTCPHGRPTAIKMTKYDIERKFARK